MALMHPRFEVRLQAVLERLYLEAVATVRMDELYMWFDAQRLNKRAYRFILQRWQEFCNERGYTEAPEIAVMPGDSILSLRRKPFEGEAGWELLASWAE
jgi:hypothetical protein